MNTIVMIHGMWCGPWCWENYRRFFEQAGYRCVVAALPFHDVPPDAVPDPRLGTASLMDYAAAIEKEILALGTKPILMGHSMGGVLAQILGTRGLAKAIVLLAPAPPAGIWAVLRPSVLRSFWSIIWTWKNWCRPLRQTFDEAVYSMLHLLPAEERKAVFDRFVFESGRATFEIGYWFLDRRRTTRIDPRRITCPMLVVAGALDRVTPPSVVRKVARTYGASYEELDRHAHWLIGEPGWEGVAGRVLGWLRNAGDRAG